ncbi:hypothetical protein ACFWNN_44150 [Lentzea sp. NPDC058450]|uniref:hypothetical protein n=1 Tax=Lentzea sp. NPDC058450 TaxID=3346505 RepID=UPI0036482767
MSHREEPRSGRGCFGAVVVVPFLALGGMFALIAFTGGAAEAPLAAPPSVRPTSQWWTEPFETAVSLSTVTETVVAEGAVREVRAAARVSTSTRVVAGTTVTETVRIPASAVKPGATGRNEPGEVEPEPPAETSSPVVTTSSAVVSSVEPPPAATLPAESPVGTPVETPAVTPPAVTPPVEVPPSTPRAEDPVVPPVTSTPVAPPCDRAEPPVGDEPPADVASPAEETSTSAAPSAGE